MLSHHHAQASAEIGGGILIQLLLVPSLVFKKPHPRHNFPLQKAEKKFRIDFIGRIWECHIHRTGFQEDHENDIGTEIRAELAGCQNWV